MAARGSRGGRVKGVPNKITRTIREAIIESFDKIGGAKWLADLAASDPRTYGQLLAKAMPTQVEGSDGGPITIRVVTGVPDEEAPGADADG